MNFGMVQTIRIATMDKSKTGYGVYVYMTYTLIEMSIISNLMDRYI